MQYNSQKLIIGRDGVYREGTVGVVCGWSYLSLTREEMWKLDRKDDTLFQCFFCDVQTSDVIPVDVGLLRHNGTCGNAQHRILMNRGFP